MTNIIGVGAILLCSIGYMSPLHAFLVVAVCLYSQGEKKVTDLTGTVARLRGQVEDLEDRLDEKKEEYDDEL